MTDESHNLNKTVVECQALSELCNTIPYLPRVWFKSESPDWISCDSIGLEIVTGLDPKQRAMYDYRRPIGKQLSAIAEDDKLSEGMAWMEASDGHSFQCYFGAKTLATDPEYPDYDDLSPDEMEYYGNSICRWCSHEQPYDIGAHVLDYQNRAVECQDMKLDLLNRPHFTSYSQNWLLVCIPEFGDTRDEYLGMLFLELSAHQAGHRLRFDRIFLQLALETIEFDMNKGIIRRHWNRRFDRVDRERLEMLMEQETFMLDEVLDSRDATGSSPSDPPMSTQH